MNQKIIQELLGYEQFTMTSKLHCYKPSEKKSNETFAEEIFNSLSQKTKSIPPKFFYNDKGSKLFNQICKLDEYYPTRTEISILKVIKSHLPSILKNNYRLVELGSGSSIKTKLILDVLCKQQEQVEYVSIDISEIIETSAKQLLNDYDNLQITGIVDNYEGGLDFIKHYDNLNNLIVFLGSSFGNFSPSSGKNFLKKVNSTMKNNDMFLIGVDLVKDEKVLEQAYNDSQGVTAQFNLNMLSRINEELGGNFDLSSFAHRAKYNKTEARIEMYLESLCEQSVNIPDANILLNFKCGELITTEHSHKFSILKTKSLLEDTGFKINNVWLDEEKYFGLFLASKTY